MSKRCAALTLLAVAGLASPALAQETAIRPSRALTVESATTMPVGENMFSYAGTSVRIGKALTDRLQLDVYHAPIVLLPTAQLTLPLTLQAKMNLMNSGMFSVGAGAGAGSTINTGGLTSNTAFVFVPFSFDFGAAGLNLVPKATFDGAGTHPGADASLTVGSWANFSLIVEDHVFDFNNAANTNNVIVGAAYTGFGPHTTLAFNVLNGSGTTTNPWTIAPGFTVHLGF
jgi:hypothetical protein